ncbi:GntR family transcriptional regulator [Chitinasiproducens palmae]|nr:GntR family transcriptional regulator [Chitinasiproducens palmae]
MEFRIQTAPIGDSSLYIDQVYDRLSTAIALGELKPGERVRQSALAQRFNVSRQPISHALQLLKHEGLIQDAPTQGVEITRIDPLYMLQLYQAREALEVTATRLASERIARGETTADEIAVVTAALRAGREASEADAPLAVLVRADFGFHKALYRLSGNPVIEQMMSARWPHLMRSMLTVLDDPAVPPRAWDEHDAMAETIFAGRVDEAVGIASKHMRRAGEDMFARLTRLQAKTA